VDTFELFVANRYLRAQRKQVMISVITVISVIGVAAGVMALVIALAINNGFSTTLQASLLGATAHVSILQKEGAEGISNWQQQAEKLARIPHVTSAAPGLYEPGYLAGPVTGSGVVIKGVSIDSSTPLPDTLRKLKSGSIAGLKGAPGELPGILLGSRLADNLGAIVGKPVQLLVPNGELTPFGPRPSYAKLVVVGTFESGFYDIDMNWAFMSLPQVQKVFDLGDVVNSIDLRLDDIYQADTVAAASDKIVGPKLAASTWQEQNRQLLNALKMERIVTVVTIGLIQLVAALNIVITLIMMVMEKQRDIAILLSMGARTAQIRKIFVLQGALIGAVGTALGLITGYTVCYLADHFKWLKLDEQVYSLAYVPFSPRWVDGLWIAAAAMFVSLVATLYPARNATRIAPVESLRYE
jgi:lipoprotein-releasing system permease protein